MSLETELRVMLREVVREVVREEMGAKLSPSTDLQRELVTYAEAGELVNVSSSTIKRWVAAGRLEAFGEGKLRRVRPEDVRACLAGKRSVSKQKPERDDVGASVRSILSSIKR